MWIPYFYVNTFERKTAFASIYILTNLAKFLSTMERICVKIIVKITWAHIPVDRGGRVPTALAPAPAGRINKQSRQANKQIFPPQFVFHIVQYRRT